jgi:hypothetical protein
MSTSLSPRSSGPSGHPTRQQLDELDALLQRMLALPVNQPSDEVAEEIDTLSRTPASQPEPVSYRTPDHAEAQPPAEQHAETAPDPAPRLDDAHVDSASAPDDDPDGWVPLSSTWKPSPHTWKPLAQSWQQPRPSQAATPPAQETAANGEQPFEEAVTPNSTPAGLPSSAESTSAPDGPVNAEPKPTGIIAASPVLAAHEPPPPGWLQPLVWFNMAFDVLLLPWGPPGRWLRRDGGGRYVLGVAGILCLVAAGVLSVLFWFGWTCDGPLARIP